MPADPRRAHRNRADAGLDLSLGQLAVPNNAPAPRIVGQIRVRLDEARDLGLDRLRQQTTSPFAQHLGPRIVLE